MRIIIFFFLVGINGFYTRAQQIRPLADTYTVVYESPNPNYFYAYSPGIVRLNSGRIIATYDVSGKEVPVRERGRISISDDGGKTWQQMGAFPFMHARPFVSGNSIYVLGHNRDLIIIRSDDDGKTWSEPVKLTEGQDWHQAPCNVHYANGCVYLV
ncbi:MAG: sialidase family protein, partial [Parabacteroides sp.]|nr:sialidase family protein [Parabacteroides sp.]